MTTKEIIECLRVCCNTMCSECRMAGKKGCTDELLSEAAVKLKKNEVEINNQRCDIDALKKELKERKAAPEWISVEDEIPKESGKLYWVYRKCKKISLSCYYSETNGWGFNDVAYWMPFPGFPKPKAKTYKDVFLEAFPKATITAMGRPAVCRNNIFGEGIGCKDVRCEDCWNQPYEEEGGAE